MPRVSVVIPAYNRAALIGETLDSVLAQSFKDFEIIVVDDGSTDDTPAVLARYTDHNNMHVIRQNNQGEGAARNTGIAAAKGDYVAFVDSDDLWMPIKLERQMALFTQQPKLMWVYSDAYVFDSQTNKPLFLISQRGDLPDGNIAGELLSRDFIASPTPVVHQTIFQELGMFNHNPRDSDWDMWLRIAAKYPVGLVPEALAGYRIHSESISQRSGTIFVHNYHVATIERAVSFAPDVYGPFRRQALAAEYLRVGVGLARKGELRQARRMFLKSIVHSPNNLSAYTRLTASFLGKRFVSSWISRNRRKLGLPE